MEIGQRVGHVRIERRLGRGGMGEVFLGYDEVLERPVAVKVLAPHARLSEASRARFLREARLLSKLDHPGICRIHDLVEAGDAECLILEYIEGDTLRRLAAAGLSVTEIARLMAEVAEALAAAHDEGIIHRDLKPDNVMVTPGGRAKILDFGIARSTAAPVRPTPPSRQEGDLAGLPDGGTAPLDGTFATEDGAVVGTVRYMSPEQIHGLPLTTASDCYSLGIMLHELLTGSNPYGETSELELMMRVARAEIVPPEGVDRELAALIADLTDLDPRRRPGAADAAARLRLFLDRPAILKRRRLRRAAVAAMAAVVVGAVATVAWTAYQGRRTARIAQRLAREATAIEWRMRAEHLAPEHDIRPARREVERRIEVMVDEARRLGRLAEGPAAAAAGRGWLALGEYRRAREALERAWELGIRGPEVEYALGEVLGHLYRQALVEAGRILDPSMARDARQRAIREYRDPALEHLASAGGVAGVPPEYIAALVALYEDRLDDCDRALDGLEGVPPWFYEPLVLRANATKRRGDLAFALRNDSAAVEAGYSRSARLLEEALGTARSDPRVAAELCSDLAGRLHNLVLSQSRTVEPAEFRRAREACARALRIDPDSGEAMAAGIELDVAVGVEAGLRGRDALPLLERAVRNAQAVVRRHPDGAAARYFAGIASEQLAWQQIRRGVDPSDAIEGCFDAFTRLLQDDPGMVNARPHAGNCCYLAAIRSYWSGRDPREWIRRGLEVTRPLVDQGYAMGHNQVANLSYIQALWEREHGIDPDAAFERCVRSYAALAENATDATSVANLANALVERARSRLDGGADPTPLLERVARTLDRAESINPGLPVIDFLRTIAATLAARYARLSGGDPLPILERGLACSDRALKADPRNAEGWSERAELSLEGARAEIGAGRAPLGWIDRGIASASKALELHPGFVQALRLRAALELESARWRTLSGTSPEAALRRASRDLDSAAKISPNDALTATLRARVALLRGRWRARSGDLRSAAASFREGIEAARAAVAANGRLGEALLVRAELAGELAARSSGTDRDALEAERNEALDALERIDPLLVPRRLSGSPHGSGVDRGR